MADTYRYVGFYGRKSNPAITIAGRLFFGQVVEVSDPELKRQLEVSDDFERVSNTCHWIEADGRRCPHIKDDSEVYCQVHLLKLRFDSVSAAENLNSSNKPIQQADATATETSDGDSSRIIPVEDSDDNTGDRKPQRSQSRKKKWSSD